MTQLEERIEALIASTQPPLRAQVIIDVVKANRRATEPTRVPVGFDAFWKAYPRKVGKTSAINAWANRMPPIDAVLTALAWQSASPDWTKDGGAFIPHPATYINQGRWEDERMEYRALPVRPYYGKGDK